MSDNTNDTPVKVAISTDNAVLLLAAAEALGKDPSVVVSTSNGWFEVPDDVAKKAKVTVIEESVEDVKEAANSRRSAKKEE